ncbi:MAG: hypothetical protein HZB13_00635 [Acidobacteria bacterium]|nr:hypothetical protein [Acidobacteriota bacterium]
MHPGAVVPAYAVPDHINFDGLPVFYPGTYDSGAGQGGHPFGKYPPLDDHFYFIGSVFEHWRLTRSTSLFRSNISTAAGEMPLAALCERVYLVAQSDPATGLVVAGPVDTENAKDWGFCDTVFKSGKLLFPSVLKHNAARQLTALFAAAGDTVRSRHYAAEARRLRQAITKTFSRSNGRGDGWLRSATGIGNQPDVWGTAFAVWSGAVEGAAARNASRALAAAYRKRTAVCDGSVRHILTTDPANHGLWQQCIAKPGTYQNGGYWSTPTGWYIAAVHLTDPPAARALATEFVRSLRENRRPDGLSQAWEWLNPDTGERSNPLYVASVALPYISLAQAGLIPHPPRP